MNVLDTIAAKGVKVSNKPAEQYHADVFPAGKVPELPNWSGKTVSASWLANALKTSPAEASQPSDKSDSKAMAIGTAAHNLSLRDEDSNLVILEFNDFRTKDAKAARDEAHSRGQVAILRKDYDSQIEPMRKAFADNTVNQYILAPDSEREASIYFNALNGLPLRARVDVLPSLTSLQQGIGQIDYKTTGQSFNNFMRSFVSDHGGLVRIAHYTMAVYALTGMIPNYWLLLQSTNPPHAMQLRQINIGHALRHYMVTNGQNSVRISNDISIGIDQTPTFFNGVENPPESDATLYMFNVGMTLWGRAVEMAKMCQMTNLYPMHPEFNTHGITPQNVDFAIRGMEGVTPLEQEGSVIDFVPVGFTITPDNGLLFQQNAKTWSPDTPAPVAQPQQEVQPQQPAQQPAVVPEAQTPLPVDPNQTQQPAAPAAQETPAPAGGAVQPATTQPQDNQNGEQNNDQNGQQNPLGDF